VNPAHKDILDCAEAAAKHDQTRRLFGVLFEAAQAQRRVELHMLVHGYDARTIDIVRTRADEWDRMTVRLIEQESRRLDQVQEVEKQPAHDGWAAVAKRAEADAQAERTAEHLKSGWKRVAPAEPDSDNAIGIYEYRGLECQRHGLTSHYRPYKSIQEWGCVQCHVDYRDNGHPANNGPVEAAHAAK